ncbi:MAG: hypothetical protein IKO93_23425, partial [Lentisphaeria bacterium]|nr:hypothetical protein [Lentisphaeria bacterium]
LPASEVEKNLGKNHFSAQSGSLAKAGTPWEIILQILLAIINAVTAYLSSNKEKEPQIAICKKCGHWEKL